LAIKTFLHVGCGTSRKAHTNAEFSSERWQEVRYDIDPSAEPDIIGSMTDMSAVESESVDAIFSSHNIEHLYAHEVPVAFGEFLRVLRPDGFVVITCPDLQSVAALIAEDKLVEAAFVAPYGPITPLDILYGHRELLKEGNLHMAHRCGFTKKVLHGTLATSGFPSVVSFQRPERFDLWALGSKSNRTSDELYALAHAHFPIPPSTGQ